MAKQIYIDENGNEIQVSGTINTAELLPISGNDSTDTKTYIDTGLSGKADNEVTDISSLCTFNTDWVLPAWGFYKVTKFGKIVQISVFGASYTGGISQATTLLTLPNTAKVNYQQIILYGVSNNINIASIDGGSNEVKILPYGGDYIRLNMIIMVN